jgi:GNAT superfamily N-acetyltransferase
MTAITYRPGTLEDSQTAFEIFTAALIDLSQRTGTMAITGGDDPKVMESLWNRRRSMLEHLAKTAHEFWVAEKDGAPVGFARSIVRGSLLELTEFFVLPGEQSAGVGRELFRRAFPADHQGHRSVIATTDDRALARYQKAGVYARFPVKHFYKTPNPSEFETDLTIEPSGEADDVLEALASIDEELLGHRRDVDHRWLLTDPDRESYLYHRAGEIVGYGYLGERSGPIALLDETDFPAVLAHGEQAAHQAGRDFGVEVPLINQAAVAILLERGFRMDPFMALLMSDRPFGQFEKYILMNPPFFL